MQQSEAKNAATTPLTEVAAMVSFWFLDPETFRGVDGAEHPLPVN
jgi:hypothetical protein